MDIIVLHLHLLEPIQQRLAVVENRMDDDASREAEREEVGDRVGCREEERGVSVIGFTVERPVGLEDFGNVVGVAGAVEWLVGRDGEVGKVPSLGVNHSSVAYPQKKNEEHLRWYSTESGS
jgi:hypothetical protein